MKKIFNFFLGKHSVFILVTILLILDILLIANLIIPKTLKFLIDKHIFEIIVLTALVEVLLLLSYNLWRETPLAIGFEMEAQEKVWSLLREDTTIKSIKVLSAGLRSRATFLSDILRLYSNVNIEVATCFGEGSPNPDKTDCDKLGPENFNLIKDRLNQQVADAESRLKIYKSFNTPSFRCILLSDSHGPRYGIVGWYRYYSRNTKITGRRNIQIFIDRTTEFGVTLLHFAEKMFQEYISKQEAEIIWPPKLRSDMG